MRMTYQVPTIQVEIGIGREIGTQTSILCSLPGTLTLLVRFFYYTATRLNTLSLFWYDIPRSPEYSASYL